MSEFDYVITVRRRRRGQDEFEAEPGRVRYLRVPKDRETAVPSDAVRTRDWLVEVRELADGNLNPVSISPCGDVLVFVHGYNNALPEILDRQRLLEQSLHAEGWRGAVVSFDWPSNNSTLNYLEDRSDASEVAMKLVSSCINELRKGQEAGCDTNIHVLGHSTGAYVIMDAFAQAQKDGKLFKADWRIGQVAFIGGDVSAASVSAASAWAEPMYRRIMRLTNYSNPFDSVLAVSNAKRLGVSPRVGRVGLPDDRHMKSIDVDCGDYFDELDPDSYDHIGTFNHSWHIGDKIFARDLAMTLEGAIDRHAIPTRNWDGSRLRLKMGKRPSHQNLWDTDAERREEAVP